jgi:hypothetical protein
MDLTRHSSEGIPYELFGQHFGRSSLVRNACLGWVVFSGIYDWAYMLKMVTGQKLPSDIKAFDSLLDEVFPHRFDVRHAEPYGSLNDVAAKHGLRHRGCAHTGGSDALLTLELLLYINVANSIDHIRSGAPEVVERKPSDASTVDSTPKAGDADSAAKTKTKLLLSEEMPLSDATTQSTEASTPPKSDSEKEEQESEGSVVVTKSKLPACLLAAAEHCAQPLPPMPSSTKHSEHNVLMRAKASWSAEGSSKGYPSFGASDKATERERRLERQLARRRAWKSMDGMSTIRTSQGRWRSTGHTATY